MYVCSFLHKKNTAIATSLLYNYWIQTERTFLIQNSVLKMHTNRYLLFNTLSNSWGPRLSAQLSSLFMFCTVNAKQIKMKKKKHLCVKFICCISKWNKFDHEIYTIFKFKYRSLFIEQCSITEKKLYIISRWLSHGILEATVNCI
jgi:hypothetical protein